MDSFYTIVIMIALICLLISLIVFGILMSGIKTAPFPPVSNTCPDYWAITQTGSGANVCSIPPKYGNNSGAIYTDLNVFATATPGSTTPGVVDFGASGWSSGKLTSICQQQQWAGTFGVQWDGVSNYNSC